MNSRTAYIIFYLLIVFVCTAEAQYSTTPQSNTNKIFSVNELQQDFVVFRDRYEKELANLYLYTQKPEMDRLFDSLYRQISPMTEMEFYKMITSVSSVIKDGHSNIYLSDATMDMQNKKGLFFPLKIVFKEERMFVVQDLSKENRIKKGSEILFINDSPVRTIYSELMKRQVRDGNNEAYANWILNNYFRHYYSLIYGCPNQYKVTIKTGEGQQENVIVESLSYAQIQSNRVEREKPVKNKFIDSEYPFYFVDPINKLVNYKISTWDEKGIKGQIEQVFDTIEKGGYKTLIIDVRDNQGGNIDGAIQILKKLLDKPFNYFNGIYAVESVDAKGHKLKLKSGGDFVKLQEPDKKQFDGKVYVLINGGSFSNTASFCSQLQFHNRATFIGTETGGNKVVFSGEFGLKNFVTLPNTRIKCENSNYRLVVTDLGKNTGRGVIPDISIELSIEDLIKDEDVFLEKAMEVIRKR